MEQYLDKVPLLLLLISRIGGVTATAPLFRNKFVLPPLRAALSVLLGLIILPAAEGKVADGVLTGTGLLAGCVLELLTGLIMGLIGQLTFSAVQMAGFMLDLDMGFMNAQLFDPASGQSDPLFSTFFQSLALTVYLALNGHHWLLRALAESYTAIPAGGLVASSQGLLHVVNMFGGLLAAAVQMVLPFTAIMLLASVALAGINRAVPQMHVFAVGMGAKAVAGLAIAALLIPYLLGSLEPLFVRGHTELLRTLELMR